MSPMRRGLTRAAFLLLAALTLGTTVAVPAQVPADQRRSRLEYLQREERAILDLLAYWRGVVNDDDLFLLPADPDQPLLQGRRMPRLVQRRQAMDMANRIVGLYLAAGIIPPPSTGELLNEVAVQSEGAKDAVRSIYIPRFERDLEKVRDEFQQLNAQRDAPGQGARTWPGGRAWYFRRAVVGSDIANPNFELLNQDIGEQGGMVQVRGRVERTNCFETWEYRWRFGAPIARLVEGMQIPVTLQVALTSTPCPSPLASYLALGGGREENVLMRDAPSPVLQGAMTFGPERAAANGVQQHAQVTSVIRVMANPGQPNAWTHFRLQVYMPGQFFVVGYLYLAGSS